MLWSEKSGVGESIDMSVSPSCADAGETVFSSAAGCLPDSTAVLFLREGVGSGTSRIEHVKTVSGFEVGGFPSRTDLR